MFVGGNDTFQSDRNRRELGLCDSLRDYTLFERAVVAAVGSR